MRWRPRPGSADQRGCRELALRVLRTAGTVTNRKQGRVVYYRLAEGFPAPLREHCLAQLIELAQRPGPEDDTTE